MFDDSIVYGVMPAERWNELAPIFEARGEILPDVNNATAAVAFDPAENAIVGMLALQIGYRAEPHWIAPNYRHRVDSGVLFDVINHLKPGVYMMFPTTGYGEELAKQAGLEKVECVVYRKKE